MSSSLVFDGSNFVQELDGVRLTGQIARVYDVIKDERERSVQQIQSEISKRFNVVDPENSIQAQLRNLRKRRFGELDVRSYRKGDSGLFVYYLRRSVVGEENMPAAIKEPPLLAYSSDKKSVRLTRFVEKEKWIELDEQLRAEGYDYRGYGLWKKK